MTDLRLAKSKIPPRMDIGRRADLMRFAVQLEALVESEARLAKSGAHFLPSISPELARYVLRSLSAYEANPDAGLDHAFGLRTRGRRAGSGSKLKQVREIVDRLIAGESITSIARATGLQRIEIRKMLKDTYRAEFADYLSEKIGALIDA